MEQSDVDPVLSVIIPVYNDPDGIKSTLASLVDQTYPRDRHEVLVVDNASSDNTRGVIRGFLAEYEHVRCLTESTVQGSYAARNTGVRAASGDVFAFLDSDMTVEGEWIEGAMETVGESGADYVGTNVEITIGTRTSNLAARYNRHTGFPVDQYVQRHRYAPTCSLFVRRSVFRDVGLFDPRLISAGDLEFGNRVDDAGYDLQFSDQVIAHHPARASVAALYRKNVRIGRGQAQLQRYYPERYGTPPIPPRHPRIPSSTADVPRRDRILFQGLSTLTAAIRAVGYVREIVTPTDNGATVDAPPTLP